MVLKLKVSPDVSCLSVCAYGFEHTNPTYSTEMEVAHHITEAPSEGVHRQAYDNSEAILIRAIPERGRAACLCSKSPGH